MSNLIQSSPLEQLKARGIVSSENRAAWLAARNGGVTATEIAKLAASGRNSAYWRELIKSKRSGEIQPELTGRYIVHGKNRESAIAEWGRSRFNIEPNQVLFAASDDVRFLATPDGVGVDFDENLLIEEIKTAMYDLNPAVDGGHYASTGYADQKQWQLKVTGASRCLFVWEQHNDDWSLWPEVAPAPVHPEPRFVWVERDEKRIAELTLIALQFLADKDAYDEEDEPDYDDELDTLAVNVLIARDKEAEGKKAKEDAWGQALVRLEGRASFSQESTLARVTWTAAEDTESEVESIDEEAAKEAQPDLWAQLEQARANWGEHAANFKKTQPVTVAGKPRLTITAVKQKETKK